MFEFHSAPTVWNVSGYAQDAAAGMARDALVNRAPGFAFIPVGAFFVFRAPL